MESVPREGNSLKTNRSLTAPVSFPKQVGGKPMYALPKGRYIHGAVEKFAARTCYQLGAVFQICFACFKSEPASLTAGGGQSSPFRVPKLSSHRPAAMAPELPLHSASNRTLKSHQLQSSSIWSQARLSADYFKQVFNTTVESLSQRVGCHVPTGPCLPHSAAFSDGGERKN